MHDVGNIAFCQLGATRAQARVRTNYHLLEAGIACDGQKALEIFRANYEAFGVLVTDQDMPVMGGIMLAREIRVLAPNLPIIFITGRPTLALEAVANELGATVLAKPVSLNIFKNAILTALAFVPS